jgi:hypothetical protein
MSSKVSHKDPYMRITKIHEFLSKIAAFAEFVLIKKQ